MNNLNRRLGFAAVVLAVLVGLSHDAAAQRRGGGFGRGGVGGRGGGPGFGGFGQGVLGELRSESVQNELKLTDEQKAEIEELTEQSRPDPSEFRPIMERMRNAASDEERAAIRQELTQQFEERNKQSEQQLREILSEEQFSRLKQVGWHRGGFRALNDEDLASSVGLSDDQRQQIQSLLEEQSAARREMGFNVSDEEREQFQQQWNEKLAAVLTDEQKSAFENQIGPPPADAGEEEGNRGDRRRGRDSEMADSEIADSETEESEDSQPRRRSAPVVTEKPEGAESVMSFGNRGAAQSDGDAPDQSASDGSPADDVGDTARVADSAETGGQEPTLSFDFRYAPWTDVLTLFADVAGLTLDLNAVPPGTFNYHDSGEYTPTEALDILNGYLLPKGYVLVRRNKFLVVLNIDDGIPPNLIPDVTATELPQRGKNELMRIVIPLEGVQAETIVTEVETLLGPQGKAAALPNSNSLVVTDIGSNLRRVHELIGKLTAGGKIPTFRAIAVKHIPADQAAITLRELLGLSASVPNVSASFEDRNRGRETASDGTTRITADMRTSSLLVTAPANQMAMIEQALEAIDVEGDGSVVASTGSTEPFLRVYQVSSSDPREVTKTLDAMMPGVVVNEDGRNRKVHIFATPDQHKEIEALIRQLDGLGGLMTTEVYPLSRMDPLTASATLRAMFVRDGEDAPTVEPDLYGRRLMIRGTTDQVDEAKSLLLQLGETGVEGASTQRGRVRTLPLGGRDPAAILPLLERVWNASSPNPIRIVTPQSRGAVQDQVVPGGETRSRPFDDEADKPQHEIPLTPPDTRSSLRPSPARTRSATDTSSSARLSLVAMQDDSASGDDEIDSDGRSQAESGEPPIRRQRRDGSASADAEGEAPITVTTVGGDLLITSSDEEALDRFEQLLEDVAAAIPVRTTWTVYTLRAADATEAAAMLEQIFPTSSVATVSGGSDGLFGSLSGSLDRVGSSLMDMTGLSELNGPTTLRIIPETRLNSLFVSGPAHMVREVEDVLKILDASELPDSLRDRVPRSIPVEHADVAEVAEIVRDVYKDYLEPPQQQQQTQNMMAAILSGGGRRGSRQEQQEPAVRMTIGVDDRTNMLIVSANDALFREVEELVESVDEAARAARRTVQVVPLQNTDSVLLQQALSSLVPKVKVSTSGGQRTTTSSTSQSDSSDNNSQGPPEDVRRFFEQRMRERMQQQRSGGGGDEGRGGGDRGGFGGRPGFGRGGGGFGGRGRGGDR